MGGTAAALKKLAADNSPTRGMGLLHLAAYLTGMSVSPRQLPVFDTHGGAVVWLVAQG